MKVGDLVRNIYTDEIYVITSVKRGNYIEVSSEWLVPKEHLEVLSESR